MKIEVNIIRETDAHRYDVGDKLLLVKKGYRPGHPATHVEVAGMMWGTTKKGVRKPYYHVVISRTGKQTVCSQEMLIRDSDFSVRTSK